MFVGKHLYKKNCQGQVTHQTGIKHYPKLGRFQGASAENRQHAKTANLSIEKTGMAKRALFRKLNMRPTLHPGS